MIDANTLVINMPDFQVDQTGIYIGNTSQNVSVNSTGFAVNGVILATGVTYNFANTVEAIAANNSTNIMTSAMTALTVRSQQSTFLCLGNGIIEASAAANVLTISVKTAAGADPSNTNPVYFKFRSSNTESGNITTIAVTSAISLALTTSLGAVNAQGLRLWITAHNDAGTVRIGAIVCSDAFGPFCPSEHLKYTTTVPGSTVKTFCTSTAISTAAPWGFIGFCEWSSLTIAGAWTTPNIVQVIGQGIKKPGDIIQHVLVTGTASSTTSTSPGVTLGNSASINSSSTANFIKVRVTSSAIMVSSTTDTQGFIYLKKNGANVGLSISFGQYGGGTSQFQNAGAVLTHFEKVSAANTALTFQVSGYVSGTLGTCTLNYPASPTGFAVSQIWELQEIMG